MQPARHDPLLGGYMITFTRPTKIEVEAVHATPAPKADLQALLYDMNAFAEHNATGPLDIYLDCAAGAGI